MALHTTHFTCFDDVERAYNDTKPLGGNQNAGKDIRPIGDRARKWERIVKIDADCYALSDGYHPGDKLFPAWAADTSDATLVDMERFAPIVWRRYGQGIERVTIRNGTGPYMHTARYQFLSRHMPRGLGFLQTQQGKQFITGHGIATPLFLAKGTHLPAATYAQVMAARTNPATTRRSYHAWATGTTDITSLEFQRNGATWEFISNGGVPPAVPRTLVDKEAKATMRGAIKAFCDWALLMTPMIDVGDFKVRQEYDQQFKEWAKNRMDGAIISWGVRWGAMHRRLPATIAREIVSNPEHPMRIVLAVAMAYETEVYRQPIREQSDLTYVRARLNRWLNKVLGFIKKG